MRRQSTKFNGAPYITQRAGAAIFTQEGQSEIQKNLAYYRQNANIIAKGILGELRDAQLETVTNQTYDLLNSNINSSIQNYLRGVAEKNKDIVEYLHNQNLSGETSTDEMYQKIKGTLLSQKIGKTGYFYIINSQGIMQMHPKEIMVNTDITHYNFVPIQLQMKNGYIEYMFKAPGEDIERAKALYMSYYEPLDYILSASAYKSEFFELLNIGDLSDMILKIKIGQTGYPFVMDGTGKLIIHPELKGNIVLEEKDADGVQIFKKMIEIKNGSLHYNWASKGEAAREKIALIRHNEQMDWYVIASAYLDEFDAPVNQLRNSLIILGVIINIIMLIALYYISKKIANPLNKMAEVSTEISKGNFNISIEEKSSSELLLLSNSIMDMKTNLQLIINDISNLSENAINGKLDTRADADKYSGDFKKLIEGLNQTLDAIILPLNSTAKNIERISKGDIPELITEAAAGDFNNIKNSLNMCITSINNLVEDSKLLFNSAIEGNLNLRADLSKHSGEFKNIISGVNATLDRLVGLIDEMPVPVQITDKAKNIKYQNKKSLIIESNFVN